MGNVPVIHEVVTTFESLGDAITGHPEKARQRWIDYSEHSVIGSGVKAAIAAAKGDNDEAVRLAKNMGKATGSALLGGGFLRNVPVFQELATAGDSLGDEIAGGDDEAARHEWEKYSENSLFGSGIRAAVEASKGKMEEAERLGKAAGISLGSAVITVAAVGATVATGGALAPVSATVAAIGAGAVGAATGAVESVANDAIHGNEIDSGEAVGSGLLGGVTGAFGGFKGAEARAGRVYRVMSSNDGKLAVEMKEMPHGYRQTTPTGETWVSESTQHTKSYLDHKRAAEPLLDMEAYEITMKKSHLKSFKDDAIPQSGSKRVNRGKAQPKHVFNKERLANHPNEKVNLGIKTWDLKRFNEGVMNVKKIDPHSIFQKGKYKLVARYSPTIAPYLLLHTEQDEEENASDDEGGTTKVALIQHG